MPGHCFEKRGLHLQCANVACILLHVEGDLQELHNSSANQQGDLLRHNTDPQVEAPPLDADRYHNGVRRHHTLAGAEPERFVATRGAALAGDLAAGWAALEREAAGRAEAAALAGVAFAAGAAGKALGADAATDGTEVAGPVPAEVLAAAAEALVVERGVGVAMTQ